jgi:hypothetical protein
MTNNNDSHLTILSLYLYDSASSLPIFSHTHTPNTMATSSLFHHKSLPHESLSPISFLHLPNSDSSLYPFSHATGTQAELSRITTVNPQPHMVKPCQSSLLHHSSAFFFHFQSPIIKIITSLSIS